MVDLLRLTEDAIRLEYGPDLLSSVRTAAARHAEGGAPLPARSAALLRGVTEVRGMGLQEVYRWAGQAVIRALLREQPALAGGATTTRALLLRINERLDTELATLLPGAVAPTFDIELLGTDALGVQFRGSPLVAAFVLGAIDGVGVVFEERVEIEAHEPPPGAPDRHRLTVRIRPERRQPERRTTPPPVEAERRRGLLDTLFRRGSR